MFFAAAIATCAAACLRLKRVGAKALNREQTNEWRGWMQIAFVMYPSRSFFFGCIPTANAEGVCRPECTLSDATVGARCIRTVYAIGMFREGM